MVNGDVNTTNDDWNMTSNDYNNDTGVYVNFPSFGLQIGPMVHSFLPSSTTLRGSSSSNNNNIELSTAVQIQQSMVGLKYAIESYVNETFRRSMGEVVNGTNYTTGKFAFGDIVENVIFVSECHYGGGEGQGGSDEPVRTLEQSQQQQMSTNITVYVPGGRAFYVFGVGGWWMETIPNSMDLYKLIMDSVIGKEGDVMGGGGLASWIKNMAVNGPGSMMMSGNVDEQVGTTAMEGDLSMFQSVQGVQIVEGLTLAPTAVPVSNPDGSFGDETAISASTDDDALVEDSEETEDGIESEQDGENDPSSSVGVDDEDAAAEEEETANEHVDKSVILEANNSSSADGNNDASVSKFVIVAGALSCLLVLSAFIGLFVYRKRHRGNDDGNGRIEDDGTKIIPMSMMSDENDGFYQGYSDVYNGLFSAAGGGAGGNRDSAIVVDVEAGYGKGNSPDDRVTRSVENSTPKEDMVNKNPVVETTTIIGASAVAAAVATVVAVKDGEQSSQQDDSLVPQVGNTTTVDTRLRSLGFEANNATPSANVENGIVNGRGDTKKERPLGNIGRIVAHTGKNDGEAKDSVATVNLSSKKDDAAAAAAQDVEKANNNSPRVKRVTFAENIVAKDIHTHDILDDINAAAIVKRQSLHHNIDSTLPSPTISAAMNIIDEVGDNNAIPSEATLQEEEVQEDENDSRGILLAIGDVVRRTQSSNEDTSPPRSDPPGDELFVSSSSKKDDPPGDDIFVSKDDDDVTIETDVFSGLRNIRDDDGTSSTYGAAPMGCGNNLIQQTKEFFMCKQVRLRGQQQQQASLSMKNKGSEYNPSSADSYNPKPYDSSSTPPIVSDDEYDSEIDESSSAIVHRPWKDRWNMDPYANQTSGQRLVICSTPESLGGSNYDPDSDWDVSDAEVDFVVVDEDIFATRNLRSNTNEIR